MRGVCGWVFFGALSLSLPSVVGRFVVLLLLGLLVSSWCHESGHVVTYWRIRRNQENVLVHHCFGLALSVTVRNPEVGCRVVALAGPMGVGMLGCGMLILGMVVASPEVIAVGMAFSIHLLGVLPGTSDGNRVWGLED